MTNGNTTMYAVIGVAALLVGAGGSAYWMSGQQAEPASVTQTTEFDGDIATFQPIQELTGYNDLTVTEQNINSSGTVDDGNVVTSFNINNSDGDTLRLAYGAEFDGAMEQVDFELTNEGVDSNLDIKEAYLAKDSNDEKSLADESAIVQEFNADSSDEIDATVNAVQDGDYAVVLEVRGTDTSGISTDQDLYTWEIDGSGDSDSDESESLEVTLDNAN